MFEQDLQFVKKTILENHPGAFNSLDPNFTQCLEKSSAVALKQLKQAFSVTAKSLIIENFGKSFKDSHLWIHYDSNRRRTSIGKKHEQIFDVKQVEKGVFWIRIPTFAPSKNQIEALKKIIQEMPALRHGSIVFDLRGNGGGNSDWGTEILQALFGTKYSKFCLDRLNQKVFPEWRASQGNLEHVAAFSSLLKQQFGTDHPSIKWSKIVCQGMKQAIDRGNLYYAEKKRPKNSFFDISPYNPFTGKILAVVDKGCGSACLDFLDELKAVYPKTVLFGETTSADSVYMELRTVRLPSNKGTIGFPIKVYRNRPRGHNIPHIPNVKYNGDLSNTESIKQFILNNCF